MSYLSYFYFISDRKALRGIPKVAAIKAGHTCFLPILANKSVNLGSIFRNIGMYVCFGYTKKSGSEKKIVF